MLEPQNTILDEIKEIAPSLMEVGNDMPFKMKEGYFESLSESILQKAKMAPIVRMKKMRNWMSYAAAAMLTAVMVIGSFMYSDKKQGTDFEKYRQLDIASALDQASEADLYDYLDNNPVVSTEDLVENEPTALPNATEKIQALSNENLHHYLNENKDLEPTAVGETKN
jgi:hypothetical protein